MHVYCMMQGVLKTLSEDEKKELYSKQCLLEAEKSLNEAEFHIELARTLLQESHRYD